MVNALSSEVVVKPFRLCAQAVDAVQITHETAVEEALGVRCCEVCGSLGNDDITAVFAGDRSILFVFRLPVR